MILYGFVFGVSRGVINGHVSCECMWESYDYIRKTWVLIEQTSYTLRENNSLLTDP